MRLGWTLGAVASLGLVASCLFPAATVLSGNGGSSTTSGSSSGSSSSGDVTVVPGQRVKSYPGMTILAPSGTPGERHLVHGGNAWWLFYLDDPMTLRVASSRDNSPGEWDMPAPNTSPLTYTFGTTGLDGRTFGVDYAEPIVHVSLSSLAPGRPKAHARAVITPSTLTFDQGAPAPIVTYTTAGDADGPVTAISTEGSGGRAVVDFGGAGTSPAAIVETDAFVVLDTGSATSAYSTAPQPLDPSATSVLTRAALPLGTDLVAVWRAAGGLYAARYLRNVSGGIWPQTPTPLGAEEAPPMDREWGACATPVPNESLHVAWADPDGGIHVWALSSTAGDVWKSAPAPLGRTAGSVSELFVSCSASYVHMFTVASDGGIVASALSLANGSWSAWAPVVTPPAAGRTRCFLSGYDRVVSTGTPATPEVGLVWTESTDCTSALATELWTAVVPVAG